MRRRSVRPTTISPLAVMSGGSRRESPARAADAELSQSKNHGIPQ